MSTTRAPDRLDVAIVAVVPALAALAGMAGGAVSALGGCLAFLVGSAAGTAALRIPIAIPGSVATAPPARDVASVRSATPTAPATPVAPAAPVVAPSAAAIVPAGPNGTVSTVAGSRVVGMAKLGVAATQSDDAVAISADGARIAVADGASSAFAAGLWARGLVDSAAAGAPVFDAGARTGWLGACAEAWRADTRDTGGWWDDEARARGSFAALVVVDVDPHGRYRAAAIGDCCLIVVDLATDAVAASFPLHAAEQFGTTPPLIGVEPSTWTDWVETTGQIPPGCVAVVASDAVAQWLLADPTRAAQIVAAPDDGLIAMIDDERRSGRMVDDDVSIVLIDRRPS